MISTFQYNSNHDYNLGCKHSGYAQYLRRGDCFKVIDKTLKRKERQDDYRGIPEWNYQYAYTISIIKESLGKEYKLDTQCYIFIVNENDYERIISRSIYIN